MPTRLTLKLTPDLEHDLAELQRLRGFGSKAETVRAAVREGAARAGTAHPTPNFASLIGVANAGPGNPHRRFWRDDDLWNAEGADDLDPLPPV